MVNYIFVEKGYQMSLYWWGTENEDLQNASILQSAIMPSTMLMYQQ